MYIDVVKDPEAIIGSEPQFPRCTERARPFKRLTISGDLFRRIAELLDDGRFDEAMSCFDRALQVDPSYCKGYLMKAEAAARAGGTPEEILTIIERALEIHPREPYALAIAAPGLNDMGCSEKANHYLSLAKTVAPEDPFVLRVEEAIRSRS